MRKESKRVRENRKLIEKDKEYKLQEACAILKQARSAKFDETVELSILLGVDPRHSDQMVRGSVVLPNGLGKR